MSIDNISKGRNFDVFSTSSINTNSTSNATDAISLNGAIGVSFQTNYASVTGPQPVFQLQYSNDNTNWVDKSGKSFTTTAASGSGMIQDDAPSARYARVKVSTASTTGTLVCYVCVTKLPT